MKAVSGQRKSVSSERMWLSRGKDPLTCLPRGKYWRQGEEKGQPVAGRMFPADIQLQRTQWPGPIHHCGGHASCLGDSRFLSRAPLAEGDSKASAKRPSGSSVQTSLAFVEYCRSPSLLCFLPRFPKRHFPQ